jgi:hypothetical protein
MKEEGQAVEREEEIYVPFNLLQLQNLIVCYFFSKMREFTRILLKIFDTIQNIEELYTDSSTLYYSTFVLYNKRQIRIW